MDTREFSAWGQHCNVLASLSTGIETFLVAFSLCSCIENWVELGRTFLECIPLICFLRWSAAKVIFYWGSGIWNDNFNKISIRDYGWQCISWHFFSRGISFVFSLRVVTYICSYDHDKTFFDGYKTYLANTSHGFVLSSCYFSYFSF